MPTPLDSIPKRLLFVSAHPDDEVGAAGGLIIRVLRAGGAVRLVLAVDPAEPRFDMDATVEREQRLAEFASVAQGAGAEHTFLNLPHYPVLSYDSILPLVREIRDFQPDAVAFLQEDEYHTEHAQVARIAKRAAWHAGRSAFPECGAPHRPDALWEVEGDRPMHEPNYLLDISDVVTAKHELFMGYSSQQARKNLADAFLGLNAFRGVMYKRGTHAEAYRITTVFYG